MAATRLSGKSGALVAVTAAVAVLLVVPVFGYGHAGIGYYHVDLDVYRVGSRVWLAGGDLHGRPPSLTLGGNLPFTYPPFAAIALAPLTLVPFWLAGAALTLLTHWACWVSSRFPCCARADCAPAGRGCWAPCRSRWRSSRSARTWAPGRSTCC
jgi:Glycosyltransferase family 87